MAGQNTAAIKPPADSAKIKSEQTEAELKRVQTELERRVDELPQANQRLQQEIAERQRLQTQQLALHQVREAVGKMERANDIENVVIVLADNLHAPNSPLTIAVSTP